MNHIEQYKYEAFKPKLEQIIQEGKLSQYMKERFLEENVDPYLSSYKGDWEEPYEIFGYFLEQSQFTELISDAAITLLNELQTNATLAKMEGYIRQFKNCFAMSQESLWKKRKDLQEQITKTLHNLLQQKGVHSTPWFDLQNEAYLLNWYFSCHPEKTEAILLAEKYCSTPELARVAISRLYELDYRMSLALLPQVIRHYQDPKEFMYIAWYMVRESDPQTLALDLSKILTKNEASYFLEALSKAPSYSSGSSRAEKGQTFKKELESLLL